MVRKIIYIAPDGSKSTSRPRSVVIGNKRYINPNDEYIIRAGYIISEADVDDSDYEQRVVALIRQRYTIDQELAIQRQRDSKPEEFAAYNAYCEQCKAQAKREE